MINPGTICTVRQTGDQLWVVRAKADDAKSRRRWRLISASTDGVGVVHHSRTAGEGDLEVIETPGFEPGEAVKHNGQDAEVIEDLGADVELALPERGFMHPAGVTLRQPPIRAVASKPHLVIENIEALISAEGDDYD